MLCLQGCLPYTIKACDHHVVGKLQPCSKSIGPTPKCKHTCEAGYNVTYEKDKHYGKSGHKRSLRSQRALLDVTNKRDKNNIVFYICH